MRGWQRTLWGLAALGFLGLCVGAAIADDEKVEQIKLKEAIRRLAERKPVQPGDVPVVNTPAKLPDGALLRLGSVRFSHPGGTSAILFTPDGKELVSAGMDGTIRMWDVKTGEQTKLMGKPEPYNPQQGRINFITGLAISKDGKLIFSAAMQRGDVKVWSVEKGEEIGALGEGQAAYYGLGFAPTPDGTKLAVGDLQGRVHLYDVGGKDKKAIKTITAHEQQGGIQSLVLVAFSSDGKQMVTGGGDMVIKLWSDLDKDTPTSVEIGSHRDAMRSIAFSADNKRIVSSALDGQVRVWDVADKKLLGKFDLPRYYGQRSQMSTVSCSADGKIAAGYAPSAGFTVWEVESGKTLLAQTMDPNQQGQFQGYALSNGTISPDGTLAAMASPNGRILLYDLKTGKKLDRGEGHAGAVNVAVVSPDGKSIATGGADATVRLWNLADGKQTHLMEGHVGQIGFLQFSADGKQLFSSSFDFNDKAVSVWDVKTGQEVKTIAGAGGQSGYGNNVALSADGKYIALLGQDLAIRVREVETRKELFKTGANRSIFMAFTGDGKNLITMGYDNRGQGMTFTMVSVPDGQSTAMPNAKINNQAAFVNGMSGDGRFCILGDYQGTLKLIDLQTGRDVRAIGEKVDPAQPRQPIGGRYANPNAYAFSADGRTLAGPGAKNSICIWEMATGKERARFEGHQAQVISTTFTPDGNKILTTSMDNTVLLWDAAYIGKEKSEPMKADDLWTALAGDDARKAYVAMLQLRDNPKDAVALVGERLKPTVMVDSKKIEQFVVDLDSEEFMLRKTAMVELEKLGEIAEPYLRKALEDKPPLEVKQRIEELLGKILTGSLTTDQLRGSRCIELMEKLNLKETKEVLEKLSKGEPGDKLTKWSKDSLQRIAKMEKKS